MILPLVGQLMGKLHVGDDNSKQREARGSTVINIMCHCI